MYNSQFQFHLMPFSLVLNKLVLSCVLIPLISLPCYPHTAHYNAGFYLMQVLLHHWAVKEQVDIIHVKCQSAILLPCSKDFWEFKGRVCITSWWTFFLKCLHSYKTWGKGLKFVRRGPLKQKCTSCCPQDNLHQVWPSCKLLKNYLLTAGSKGLWPCRACLPMEGGVEHTIPCSHGHRMY